jgi:hypothetical protein
MFQDSYLMGHHRVFHCESAVALSFRTWAPYQRGRTAPAVAMCSWRPTRHVPKGRHFVAQGHKAMTILRRDLKLTRALWSCMLLSGHFGVYPSEWQCVFQRHGSSNYAERARQCNVMQCNHKVHYRIQSNSPLDDILAKSKSVHNFTHSFSKRRSVLSFRSCVGRPGDLLSSDFLLKYCMFPSPPPLPLCTICSAQLVPLDFSRRNFLGHDSRFRDKTRTVCSKNSYITKVKLSLCLIN